MWLILLYKDLCCIQGTDIISSCFPWQSNQWLWHC